MIVSFPWQGVRVELTHIQWAALSKDAQLELCSLSRDITENNDMLFSFTMSHEAWGAFKKVMEERLLGSLPMEAGRFRELFWIQVKRCKAQVGDSRCLKLLPAVHTP